jgi:hypothetical protein
MVGLLISPVRWWLQNRRAKKAREEEFELHEKESLVPVGLSGKESVLDGFCNPVSILGHSFSLKKVFLIMKRRRWKEAGTDKHLTNNYEFEPHSAKMTNEMAAFLKGIH